MGVHLRKNRRNDNVEARLETPRCNARGEREDGRRQGLQLKASNIQTKICMTICRYSVSFFRPSDASRFCLRLPAIQSIRAHTKLYRYSCRGKNRGIVVESD